MASRKNLSSGIDPNEALAQHPVIVKAQWTILIFATGLVGGWFIRGADHLPSNAADARELTAGAGVRKRESHAMNAAHDAKVQAIVKQFAGYGQTEKEAFIKNLVPQDRAAAVDALLARIGPRGIDNVTECMIEGILKAWSGEDFDEAWAWSQQLTNEANREFIIGKLLQALVKTDPERAIALHVELSEADAHFSSSVPGMLIGKMTLKGSDEFLDFLNKLPFTGGSSGGPREFAKNFDFQKAADGVAALMKSREGRDPPAFPTNFLSKWAESDPEAAFAWYAKNPNLPFNDLRNIMEGVQNQGVPGAASAWVAQKLEEPDAPREKMIRALSRSADDQMAGTIDMIAQALPDIPSRDRFLTDVMVMNCSGNAIRDLGFTVSGMSSPQVRLEAFQSMKTGGSTIVIGSITDYQFETWGITRQQVETIFHR